MIVNVALRNITAAVKWLDKHVSYDETMIGQAYVGWRYLGAGDFEFQREDDALFFMLCWSEK